MGFHPAVFTPPCDHITGGATVIQGGNSREQGEPEWYTVKRVLFTCPLPGWNALWMAGQGGARS